VLSGFFGLLAESHGILFGPTVRIGHIVAGFNAHFGGCNPGICRSEPVSSPVHTAQLGHCYFNLGRRGSKQATDSPVNPTLTGPQFSWVLGFWSATAQGVKKLQDSLAYPPRMMNADRAAYVDISKTKFLEGVDNGTWPAAKDVGGMPRWDRLELDAAVDALDQRNRKSTLRRKSFDDLVESNGDEGGPRVRQ
jgi:hypothetical protein